MPVTTLSLSLSFTHSNTHILSLSSFLWFIVRDLGSLQLGIVPKNNVSRSCFPQINACLSWKVLIIPVEYSEVTPASPSSADKHRRIPRSTCPRKGKDQAGEI